MTNVQTHRNRQDKKLHRETDRQRRESWNDIDKQTRKKLHRETDRQRRERWNDTDKQTRKEAA